jgi:integrase
MSVRKRTLPSGEVRWLLDYKDLSGKRRAKQFKTKGEAVAFETKTRAEVAAGTHTADSATITVAKAGQDWLQRCRTEGLEDSTLGQYGEHVRLHIDPLIGNVKLSKLTRPSVEAFKDTLLESRSRALSKKVLTSLKGILKDAMRRGNVNQNVAADCEIGISNRKDKRAVIPAKEAVRMLIAKAGEIWPVSLPWRPIIITAVFCGLRMSELRGLLWENVDFDKRLIRVRQRANFKGEMGPCKSGAGFRDIPLAPMAINALRTWRLACGNSENGLVFTIDGRVIRKDEVHRDCWRPLAEAAGLVEEGAELPRYRFHDLRHVAASLLIESGWQAKKIQAVMGHSSITMTFDLYGHLWEESESDAEAAAQAERRLLS